MLYTAQLWSPRAQVKQCFNCCQWGHNQASCNKAMRCREYAGAHWTRDCPQKAMSCSNCGRAHSSWQKRSCQKYTAYKASVSRARDELWEKTAGLRKEVSIPMATKTPTVKSGTDQEFHIVTRQKTYGTKRRRGRPRKQVPAPKDSATTSSILIDGTS